MQIASFFLPSQHHFRMVIFQIGLISLLSHTKVMEMSLLFSTFPTSAMPTKVRKLRMEENKISLPMVFTLHTDTSTDCSHYYASFPWLWVNDFSSRPVPIRSSRHNQHHQQKTSQWKSQHSVFICDTLIRRSDAIMENSFTSGMLLAPAKTET